MADSITPLENIDNIKRARKIAATMLSSIDTNTWSLRDIKKSAKKILELLEAMD